MPTSLFQPAQVTDRSDRAWCMAHIATVLSEEDPARDVLMRAAARHAEVALAHIASGDYAGEHWLASFAVHFLTSPAR